MRLNGFLVPALWNCVLTRSYVRALDSGAMDTYPIQQISSRQFDLRGLFGNEVQTNARNLATTAVCSEGAYMKAGVCQACPLNKTSPVGSTSSTACVAPADGIIGCFTDCGPLPSHADRDLPVYTNLGNLNTWASCAAQCTGYTYFGVEFETECRCGNSYGSQGVPDASTTGKSACDLACPTDVTCGGSCTQIIGLVASFGLRSFLCPGGSFITNLTLQAGAWMDRITSIECSDTSIIQVNAGENGGLVYSPKSGDSTSTSPGYCSSSHGYTYFNNVKFVTYLQFTECETGSIDGPYGGVGSEPTTAKTCDIDQKVIGINLSVDTGLTSFTIVCGSVAVVPMCKYVIKQASGTLINLAEARVYKGSYADGVQVPSTVTLSSVYTDSGGTYPAYLCGDGDPNTFCNTAEGDIDPTLTVTWACDNGSICGYEAFIQNRLDCCSDRIIGASIISYNADGSFSNPTIFPAAYNQYEAKFCVAPTPVPTESPTAAPSPLLTPLPTPVPTKEPTPVVPTVEPSIAPTAARTPVPTPQPTVIPTPLPTVVLTAKPTTAPTAAQTSAPTPQPTSALGRSLPTITPTTAQTSTQFPSAVPTITPTLEPVRGTPMPTPAATVPDPTPSPVAPRDVEISFTIRNRAEANFTADDKSKLIAATAQLAKVSSDRVRIDLFKNVPGTPVGRRLDTSQVLQVKEHISASGVATSDLSDSAANLSANSGMQIDGITVIENPPPPPKGSNMGLILGLTFAAVGVFGIAMGALSWRHKKRNNKRAPRFKRQPARDPSIEYIDKLSPSRHDPTSAPFFSATNTEEQSVETPIPLASHNRAPLNSA